MKKLVLAMMGCAALLAATVSHAEIKPIFSAGLTFGGEDMYTTTYSGASSSESVCLTSCADSGTTVANTAAKAIPTAVFIFIDTFKTQIYKLSRYVARFSGKRGQF